MRYLGGSVKTPNGSSTKVDIPDNANTFWITANGGDVYYELNGSAASANSAGFVAQGQRGLELSLANLTSLHVYAAAGATKAHIEFFIE